MNFQDYKKELMQNPEFRKEYDSLETEFKIKQARKGKDYLNIRIDDKNENIVKIDSEEINLFFMKNIEFFDDESKYLLLEEIEYYNSLPKETIDFLGLEKPNIDLLNTQNYIKINFQNGDNKVIYFNNNSDLCKLKNIITDYMI